MNYGYTRIRDELRAPRVSLMALIDVLEERRRQIELRKQGKFVATCADDISDLERLPILAEEFGEVARAMCERDRTALRTELVQLAAAAVAWIEGILDADRRADLDRLENPKPEGEGQ